MNTQIDEMLRLRADAQDPDKKNLVKEILQEIVLCGLSRAGFFKKAAFYGGTALRIFYGLDRFSEDLDFSLMEKDLDFDLAAYFPMLEKELESYGLNMTVSEKEKYSDTAIQSAFLKGNTRELLLQFYTDPKLSNTVPSNESLRIKFEIDIDIDPPAYAEFERRYKLLPSPHEVNLYDLPSLFAGKTHAVLCRAWKNRIKGRDLYDYVFYLSRDVRINLPHLKERLIASGALAPDDRFDLGILKDMLNEKFNQIDYASAKEDVRHFIRDEASLELWSADFFKAITAEMH